VSDDRKTPSGQAVARGGWKDWRRLIDRAETRMLLLLLVVVSALAGFAALAGEVMEGDTAAIDRRLLLAFRVPGHLADPVGPRWLQESARDITALGGFTVLSMISIGAAVALVAQRRIRQATVFGASVVIAQVVGEAVKQVADRPRPDVVSHLDLVYSSSFPSGHALMSPVVYLTLAGVLAASLRERSEKILLICSAAALVVLIGVSRVYLGVHWPTDVLGGWILGCLIAFCATWTIGRTPARADRYAEEA
jgi:undecaprenyl-diphosphatase